ncbi:MAG: hypothetical protein H6684_04095 [Deltaproteobacteria bacterium]|nr:hypothetical protein [Deltaproteobacteria bacterium]
MRGSFFKRAIIAAMLLTAVACAPTPKSSIHGERLQYPERHAAHYRADLRKPVLRDAVFPFNRVTVFQTSDTYSNTTTLHFWYYLDKIDPPLGMNRIFNLEIAATKDAEGRYDQRNLALVIFQYYDKTKDQPAEYELCADRNLYFVTDKLRATADLKYEKRKIAKDRYTETLSTDMDTASFLKLVDAESLRGRFCHTEFELPPEALRDLKNFAELLELDGQGESE